MSKKIGPINITERFLLDDFLSLTPRDFGDRLFRVVIGNPPYVASPRMYKKQKETVARVDRSSVYSFRGPGSLWAYFIIHSLTFLQAGGRMAWILPGSLMHTFYGGQLIDHLQNQFAALWLLPLKQKLFLEKGAKEDSVVLLAQGWRQGPAASGTRVISVSSLNEFGRTLRSLNRSINSSRWFAGNRESTLLSPAGRAAYRTLKVHRYAMSFGDVAEIKIGVVTGDNSFFLLNRQQANQRKLRPEVLRSIFGRKVSMGLNVTEPDLKKARSANARCLLLSASKVKKGSALASYLCTYSKRKRDNVLTFKKRDVWFKPDDGRDPDAFFSYMSDIAPRLLLNEARTTCTNSIHRVFFQQKKTPLYRRKLFAISMLTSFTNLSAELVGRTYGDGVLKLEPSEVTKLKVFIPIPKDRKAITRAFRKIDRLLRSGDFDRAQREADAFVFGSYKTESIVKSLRTVRVELTRIRNSRTAKRQKLNGER